MPKRQISRDSRDQSSDQTDKSRDNAGGRAVDRLDRSPNSPVLAGKVVKLQINAGADGQRLDNFLMGQLKGAPRSLIYRIIRRGEVRVNSGRSKADRRLVTGDLVRIPPVRLSPAGAAPVVSHAARFASETPLFEDEHLLVVNKPSGLAVHAGSTLDSGLVEQFREQRQGIGFLELAHRLDRDTSGCLVLAKDRKTLLTLHEQFRRSAEVHLSKKYVTLMRHGSTPPPLKREMVCTVTLTDPRDRQQQAHSVFVPQRRFGDLSLMNVVIQTGRKHQIRRHAAVLSMPVAGDDRYGDFELNRRLRRQGLKRLFLHASSIQLKHPRDGRLLTFAAELPPELSEFVDRLTARGASRDQS